MGIVVLLCTYLFTRQIAPLIARLRSRQLVEEQQEDIELEVPPSSDRNQIRPAPETEEAMDK